MNSENVVKHLRALWRFDRIIAEIRMRHMLVGLGLRAFAALIAAFGLVDAGAIGLFRAGADLERDFRGRNSRRRQFRDRGQSCSWLAEGRPQAANSNWPPKFTAPRSKPCRTKPARCNRSSPAWCTIP